VSLAEPKSSSRAEKNTGSAAKKQSPKRFANGASEFFRSCKAAQHVLLIVEENHSFASVYPGTMPWLSALGDKYGIATNYFSNETGSLLDYLWLSSEVAKRPLAVTATAARRPSPMTTFSAN
jgi:phospholipase C